MFSINRMWCHHQDIWEKLGSGVDGIEWQCPICHKKETYVNGCTPMRNYRRIRKSKRYGADVKKG